MSPLTAELERSSEGKNEESLNERSRLRSSRQEVSDFWAVEDGAQGQEDVVLAEETPPQDSAEGPHALNIVVERRAGETFVVVYIDERRRETLMRLGAIWSMNNHLEPVMSKIGKAIKADEVTRVWVDTEEAKRAAIYACCFPEESKSN